MTTYYFIRHAEKEQDGTRDPHLTAKGKQRAQHWANLLADKAIDAIYCTPLQRTQETAQPLLNALGLAYKLYNPRDLYSLNFQQDTKNKTVLIVGHQDTTPAFINRILNEEKYYFIDHDNYGNLYKISIDDRGKIDAQHYQIDF